MTRIVLSNRLFALAVFALGAVASSPTVAQTDVLVVEGTRVRVLATTETLKVCVSSSPRTSGRVPDPRLSLHKNLRPSGRRGPGR